MNNEIIVLVFSVFIWAKKLTEWINNVEWIVHDCTSIDLSTRHLSAREEVVAGVALGVVEQLGPGKSTHGPEQEVSGVAAEDPVVGPLVVIPVAARKRRPEEAFAFKYFESAGGKSSITWQTSCCAVVRLISSFLSPN